MGIMANGISLLLKGIGALTSFTVVLLLVFVNGIIGQPLMGFIMSGTYTRTFGIDIIPIIQIAILFMALAAGIICFVSAYLEIYAEAVYNAGF
jgi:hypothetical protein